MYGIYTKILVFIVNMAGMEASQKDYQVMEKKRRPPCDRPRILDRGRKTRVSKINYGLSVIALAVQLLRLHGFEKLLLHTGESKFINPMRSSAG